MTRGRFWLLLLALALVTLACYTTVYEPMMCLEGTVDTVGVVTREYEDGTVDTAQRLLWQECRTWQVAADTTRCWDYARGWLACQE